MDNQAIPVNFNAKAVLEKITKKVEKFEGDYKKEDTKLLELVQTDGWQHFKKLIESKIDFLKSMIDPESGQAIIDLSDSPFEVGLKYIIVSFTIYQLRQALNLPEAVLEAEKLNEAGKSGK